MLTTTASKYLQTKHVADQLNGAKNDREWKKQQQVQPCTYNSFMGLYIKQTKTRPHRQTPMPPQPGIHRRGKQEPILCQKKQDKKLLSTSWQILCKNFTVSNRSCSYGRFGTYVHTYRHTDMDKAKCLPLSWGHELSIYLALSISL